MVLTHLYLFQGEASAPVTSSAVFSMFGGGAKKEKKEEDDDRGDNSGSAKAQRDAAAAAKDGDDVSGPEVTGTPSAPISKSMEGVLADLHTFTGGARV